MQWIELVGSPGSGKSTLIDYRFPPDYITYDASIPPKEWKEFLDFTHHLLDLTSRHKEYRVGVSLVKRSIKKMTTVYNTKSSTVYIQTGFMQRALGLYRRLPVANRQLIEEYLEMCPTPLGVIVLYADIETLKNHNRSRKKQDRSHMLEATEACMELVRRSIKKRELPWLQLDTRNPIAYNRKKILDFEQYLHVNEG